MRALDLLCVPFAWAVHVRVQMSCVRAPMIGVKAGESKGLQERFELEKNVVLTPAKDLRQDCSSGVIDGMPQPALVAFLADKTPHLIHLGFPSSLNGDRHLFRVYGTKQSRVDRLESHFFLSDLTEHGVRTDLEHPRRIANPTRVEAHVNDRLLHLRQASAVAVVEQKTAFGTRHVLG